MKKENQFTHLFLSLLVKIEFSIHYNYVPNALSMTDIQEKKTAGCINDPLNFF